MSLIAKKDEPESPLFKSIAFRNAVVSDRYVSNAFLSNQLFGTRITFPELRFPLSCCLVWFFGISIVALKANITLIKISLTLQGTVLTFQSE